MSSPLGNKQTVKVFVLYLMQHVGYPMDFITINDIIMQTDYVAYLDFAESFAEMADGGLIEEVGKNPAGEPAYAVTAKGRIVVESMQNAILPSILEEALARALRHLDFSRRGVKVSCHTQPAPGGGFTFQACLTEQGSTLISVELHVDTAAQAAGMEAQFRASPEHMYRAMVALLSGNVNYLF